MIEKLDYAAFEKRFIWKQSEHIIVIGPTGVGKTTLIRDLIPRRKNVLFFGTKGHDEAYDDMLKYEGFRKVRNVNEIQNWDRRVLLWPKHQDGIRKSMLNQRAVFVEAMDMLAEQGSWTPVLDEAKYMNQQLRLGTEMTYLSEQLRSDNGSIIFGTQRPVWISSVISSATHVFIWKTPDGNDMAKLADIGGVDAKLVKQEIQTLENHEFLYIHTRGADVDYLRTKVRK